MENMQEFDTWNEKKKNIHNIQQCPMFLEREIWWCSLGINVGDEQDGKGKNFTRPVLVLKKFNHNLFVGMPMSTKIKESKFYHKMYFKGKQQSVILSQIKLMDARRLKDKMGRINDADLSIVKDKIKELIF